VCSANEYVFMSLAMTLCTEGDTIRNIIAQFGVGSEGLNVVRVKLNCLAMAFIVVFVAILASIVISFKDSASPIFVFLTAACQIVLVRFVDMIGEPGALCLLPMFFCPGMQSAATFIRTRFSQLPTLAIFWHRFFAHRTWHEDRLAVWANLIILAGLARASATNATGNPYASCVSFQSGGTRDASCVLGLFAGARNSGRGLATRCAGFRQPSMAIPTDAVISRFTTDDAAPILFPHRGILAQVPALVKLTLERMAGMGLEPQLS